MTEAIFDKLQGLMPGLVKRDEPMAAHTTWRVGGAADLFLTPECVDQLHEALRHLQYSGTPWYCLGGGSNLLISDAGFRGAIVSLERFKELVFLPDSVVAVQAGVALGQLIGKAVAKGFSGLESLVGIPGTVGGAIIMNAGAGGQQMADVVQLVRVLGPDGIEHWGRSRLKFGYRSSPFPPDRILVEATMKFRLAESRFLEAELRKRKEHRRTAHKVEGPNAGSVFKNPPEASAWQLIDQAGMRGVCEGAAKVSEQHANFIVNTGGATAKDILTLIRRVQKAVRSHTGVELETEVRILEESTPYL